jgi:hypothetical protein
LAAVVCLAAIAGCDRKKKIPDLSVAEWLDVRSPFESFNGARMLSFVINNKSVKLTEAVGEEIPSGALMAKHPKVTRGTWAAEEATKDIVVKLGDTETRYTLAIPFGEGDCILVSGPISAADLRASWFREPDFSDPDSRG